MRVPFNAHVAQSLIILNTTAFIAKNTPYKHTYTHTEWIYKIRLLILVTKRVRVARVLMDAIRQTDVVAAQRTAFMNADINSAFARPLFQTSLRIREKRQG